MKKASKVLAAILSASLCLSMTGCGGSQTAAEDTGAAATEAPAEETEATEAAESADVNENGVEGKTMPNGVTYYFEDVDTLYVGSYGGTYDEAFQIVADRFTEDTGVKVVFDSSWNFSKLVSENHHPSVGVCVADDVRLFSLQRRVGRPHFDDLISGLRVGVVFVVVDLDIFNPILTAQGNVSIDTVVRFLPEVHRNAFPVIEGLIDIGMNIHVVFRCGISVYRISIYKSRNIQKSCECHSNYQIAECLCTCRHRTLLSLRGFAAYTYLNYIIFR